MHNIYIYVCMYVYIYVCVCVCMHDIACMYAYMEGFKINLEGFKIGAYNWYHFLAACFSLYLRTRSAKRCTSRPLRLLRRRMAPRATRPRRRTRRATMMPSTPNSKSRIRKPRPRPRPLGLVPGGTPRTKWWAWCVCHWLCQCFLPASRDGHWRSQWLT